MFSLTFHQCVLVYPEEPTTESSTGTNNFRPKKLYFYNDDENVHVEILCSNYDYFYIKKKIPIKKNKTHTTVGKITKSVHLILGKQSLWHLGWEEVRYMMQICALLSNQAVMLTLPVHFCVGMGKPIHVSDSVLFKRGIIMPDSDSVLEGSA